MTTRGQQRSTFAASAGQFYQQKKSYCFSCLGLSCVLRLCPNKKFLFVSPVISRTPYSACSCGQMAFAVPVWLAVQEELLSGEPETVPPGSSAAAPSCFDGFTDDDLFKIFHLSRPCITFVADAVRNRVKTTDFKWPAPSVDEMMMLALNFYAQGMFTPSVALKLGTSHRVSLTTVVNTMSGVIAGMSDVFISFPLTAEARTRTASKTEELCGIPGVLGALAPAHFKIRASPYDKSSFKSFISALGYTSVVSQVICDSEGNILSVEKCCVGSTHEQDMWESSFKGRQVEDGAHGPFWFVGKMQTREASSG